MTNQHTEQSELAELPLLPKETQPLLAGYTADQMRDYARAALLAADKAGGEPVAYLRAETTTPEYLGWGVTTADDPNAVPLYTRPQPQPVPDDVVKDAEQLLRDARPFVEAGLYISEHGSKSQVDIYKAAEILRRIDAAMLKEEK